MATAIFTALAALICPKSRRVSLRLAENVPWQKSRCCAQSRSVRWRQGER